jgi:rod shape determining protein RodA
VRAAVWRRFDWYLLALAVALGGFGVLMVASALSGNEVLALWPYRQAGFLVVGLAVLFVTAALDYRLLTSVAYPFYLVLLGMLVAISIIGTVAGGAQRWLTIGEFLFQPSELVKLGVILALAHYLSSRQEQADSIFTPVLALLLIAPAVVLIYLQPNLSTALALLVIGIVMLVVGGLRWWHALVLLIIGGATAVFSWRYLFQEYMKDRVLMFLDPAKVPAADRYNIDQAVISIGSGGWLGRGLFSGSQSQLHFLRVRHTDFIFSVTAEELGFVGAVVLIVLFALLLWRLIHVAGIARDAFGRLIVTGVATMILMQFTVNVGMNLNLVPVSGMPLPFISYGGSSLLTMLIGIGLAESVAMRHRKIEFE